MKEWVRSLEIGVEEVILASIIILNIFDAFEILPPDLDYIKKIISWSALAVMFAETRLDRVLAGTKDLRANYLLIGGFFLLTLKNLTGYAMSVIHESSTFLYNFYSALIQYATQIEYLGILFGVSLLLAACARLATKGIHRPSMGYALLQRPLKKFFPSFLLLFGLSIIFFIGVFNVAMEWLAIAIDAPLLMVGLALFILHLFRSHKFQWKNSLLSKFGSFGISLYEKVILSLERRRQLYQVAAAVLVLHGVTDSLIFLWPAIFGVGDQLYLASLPGVHPSFWQLLSGPILNQGAQIITYLANIFALGFILCFPTMLWFEEFQKKLTHLSKKLTLFIVFCILLALLTPAFSLSIAHTTNVYGINIALLVLEGAFLLEKVLIAGLTTLLIGLWVKKKSHEHLLQGSLIAVTVTSYCAYILAYHSAIGKYYQEVLPLLFSQNSLLAILFVLFALATISILLAGLVGLTKITLHHMQRHHILHKHHTKKKT